MFKSVKIFTGLLLAAGVSTGVIAADMKNVAIANLGPHPALNAVVAGFKKGLEASGYKENKKVKFTYQDASFDASVVAQMLSALEASGPDVILTITTPITQASRRMIKNKSIPIVFAPVTDPVDAGLVPSWDGGSDRYTGASNLQSMETVVQFARKLLGDINSIGILYNPGDANDMVNKKYIEAAAKKEGLKFKGVSVETANDIPVRVEALKDMDFIYLIPSSMLQPALPAVAAAARRNNVHVINASPVGVKDGQILASMSVSWFQVGQKAGMKAAQILDGTPVKSIKIFRPSPEDHAPLISAKYMKAHDIKLPDALKDCDCVR